MNRRLSKKENKKVCFFSSAAISENSLSSDNVKWQGMKCDIPRIEVKGLKFQQPIKITGDLSGFSLNEHHRRRATVVGNSI